MSYILSFPNFLCLLLAGALIVHLASRDQVSLGLPEAPDRLEDRYCRLPQSHWLEGALQCSSAEKLFLHLGNGCSFEHERKEEVEEPRNDTEVEEVEEVEEEEDVTEGYEEVVTVEVLEEGKVDEKRQSLEEVKASMVDSLVISLLVCSVIVSILEWYREKAIKQQVPAAEGGTSVPGGGETTSDRRISLADLTVNRHIRRGDSQHLESIRQNTTSPGSKPPLLRRSSFPAQMPEGRSRHAPQRQQSTPTSPVGRRLSVDLGEDDGSPDRRRVRIIRRH